MPLPEFVKSLAEKKIDTFCDKKIPPEVRHQVHLSYKIRGNIVTLFENRAPWHPEMKEWTSRPIAQVRYDNKQASWSLYCADRNSKWHEYREIGPTQDLDKVLAEIDADPTRIFWG